MNEPIVITTRSASDGSFILLDKEHDFYFEVVNALYRNKRFFTNSAISTVEYIHTFSKKTPAQEILSVSSLAEHFGISMSSLTKRLKALRDLQVLNKIPVVFSDGSRHPKVACEVIRIDHLLTHESLNPNLVNADEDTEEIINQRWSDKRRLKEYGIKDLPTIDREKLPQVVSLQSHFLANQLAATEPRLRGKKAEILREKRIYSQSSRKLKVRTEDGITKTFVAEIRSYTGIMDPSDLQVLYAVYTLIRHYHKIFTSKFKSDSILTPVHVNHIVALLGKSRCGPNTAYIRDSLQAIEDTEYNLMALEKSRFEFADGFYDAYGSAKFKHFDKCIPLSENCVKVEEDGRVKLSEATIYLIAIPEFLFNRLMGDETLFVFPQESLKLHPLLFSLYLRLRITTRNNKFSERLSTTHKAITTEQQMSNFKIMLRRSLGSLEKSKSPHLNAKLIGNDLYEFNLFGYHGKVSFLDEYLSGFCDLDEMLACCDAERREGYRGTCDTPTIHNELSLNFQAYFERVSARHITTIARSKNMFYMMKYWVQNCSHPILVSKFYSLDAIEEIVDWMTSVSEASHEKSLLLDRIVNDLDSLNGLSIWRNGELSTLTEDEVKKIVEYIGVLPIYTDMSKFMISLSRRRSLHPYLCKILDDIELVTEEWSVLEALLEDCEETLGYIERCQYI